MASPPKKAVADAAPKDAAPKTKAAAKPKAAPKAKAAAAEGAAEKPKRNMDALQKPLTPSPELAEIVGPGQLARGQVVSKVWDYIRKHDLQNPKDKREILADAKLEKVFGRKSCTMFEMNKYLALHLK